MDIATLYYYYELNVFIDEDGEIVYDIFRIIRPARLEYLKNLGGGTTEYVYNRRDNTVYELIFEYNEEEDYE